MRVTYFSPSSSGPRWRAGWRASSVPVLRVCNRSRVAGDKGRKEPLRVPGVFARNVLWRLLQRVRVGDLDRHLLTADIREVRVHTVDHQGHVDLDTQFVAQADEAAPR